MQNLAKSAVVAAIALLPAFSLKANEISISLYARVEPRCEVVGIGQSPDLAASAMRISVSCNAPQYQLRFVGSDGPVAVKVSTASASIGTTTVISDTMMVSPLRPGFHVFDIELPEGGPDQGMLMVQLDGF